MSLQPPEFSEYVLSKARRLVRTGRVVRDEPDAVGFRIVGDTEGKTYWVQSDFDPRTRKLSWWHCTCTHGTKVGAGAPTCSHAAAMFMILQEKC